VADTETNPQWGDASCVDVVCAQQGFILRPLRKGWIGCSARGFRHGGGETAISTSCREASPKDMDRYYRHNGSTTYQEAVHYPLSVLAGIIKVCNLRLLILILTDLIAVLERGSRYPICKHRWDIVRSTRKMASYWDDERRFSRRCSKQPGLGS
jgi:hypothetical protein